MQFHEKLRKRVNELGLNKSKAARDAGLPESTISNYLVKEDSLPRIDIAKKIAKAIRVPLDWLADDASDWPPPDPREQSLRNIRDRDLIKELATRLRESLVKYLEALDVAEKTDWQGVLRQLAGWKPNDPWPETLRDVNEAIQTLGASGRNLDQYDPWDAGLRLHSDLKGGDRPAEEFTRTKVMQRHLSLQSRPEFQKVRDALSAHLGHQWDLVSNELEKAHQATRELRNRKAK